MIKILSISAGVLLFAVIAGALLMNTDTPENVDTTPAEPAVVFVKLNGELACLPHVVNTGSTTLECAYGLKDANGKFYALDTSAMNTGSLFSLNIGQSIEVTGPLTDKVKLPSADSLQKYNIVGSVQIRTLQSVGETVGNGSTTIFANGSLSFTEPKDFAVALTKEQVLVTSVIPPCTDGFDFCLYYNSDTYASTSFNSAGLRIESRADLIDESMCTSTEPEGYSDIVPEVETHDGYTTTLFTPIDDAGAGHYAEGSLYRLWLTNSCYEFETRIGESQFENYATGTVTAFTEEDHDTVLGALNDILNNIILISTNKTVVFPQQ